MSGTVKWKNTPLAWGTIVFEPIGDRAEAGGSADIEVGRFEMKKERGLVPGKYRVRIIGGSNPADNPQQAGPRVDDGAPRDMVPPSYNEKSTLEATITQEGPNELEFNLR